MMGQVAYQVTASEQVSDEDEVRCSIFAFIVSMMQCEIQNHEWGVVRSVPEWGVGSVSEWDVRRCAIVGVGVVMCGVCVECQESVSDRKMFSIGYGFCDVEGKK